MELTRRSFLRGALTVFAAAGLPAIAMTAGLPVLHGDGVTDDTEALNAMFAGKSYIVGGEIIPDGSPAIINGGKFRISNTLVMSFDDIQVSGASFEGTFPSEAFFLDLKQGYEGYIENCNFSCVRQYDEGEFTVPRCTSVTGLTIRSIA